MMTETDQRIARFILELRHKKNAPPHLTNAEVLTDAEWRAVELYVLMPVTSERLQ